MAMSVKQLMGLVVSFIVIGAILPMGLAYIVTFGDAVITLPNGTQTTLSAVADPNLITLVEILLPVLGIIGIIMSYVAYKKWS